MLAHDCESDDDLFGSLQQKFQVPDQLRIQEESDDEDAALFPEPDQTLNQVDSDNHVVTAYRKIDELI